MTGRLEILVVDDHAVVREGLKRILQECDDCAVTAEAESAEDALTLLRTDSFDLVLLDLSLPQRSGLDLLKIIKRQQPKLPVLVLSAYREDQYAVRALKDGADGYLNEESAPQLLVAAIRKVASGGRFLTPALAERIAWDVAVREEKPPHEMLSDREFEILKLIARGDSLKDIADQLHISAKTVTTYRSRIIEKTGLATNADLTRYMLKHDLLD